MKRYPIERERIVLDGGLAELEAVKRRRRKICTSKKFKYAWMTFDPCAELPVIDDEEELPRIVTSKSANDFFHDAVPFAGKNVEYIMILCLNTKNVPQAIAVPHKGGRNASVVDMSVVLQAVLLSGSPSFIIGHNHPSQEPSPSQEDVQMTRRLRRGAELVKLQLLDHIILTDRRSDYFSMLDAGLMRDT